MIGVRSKVSDLREAVHGLVSVPFVRHDLLQQLRTRRKVSGLREGWQKVGFEAGALSQSRAGSVAG